ncbi:MAG: valine--tRNA ligase [Planctomycetes bacterium]|nr:valine--tRNA ligase [Planctomycetota bacterium]
MTELAKQYDSKSVEAATTRRWLDAKAFAATPDDRAGRYVVMMPLPNVTGALHMGHAIDNVMQDLLIRWHRMQGDNTLWQAGTDHAGIATQSVVEKRLFQLEGKTRHDVGRESLVERIWEWKDQYQQRIVQQQQGMGCSCDWDRQRFTMDAVCARAVRETFFRMFRDGLIFQGDRLVNWDCKLHTAVADDELEKRTVQGHFWHLKYPVVDPRPGEPEFIVVATTRPETMLGDTAVACHGDPGKAIDRVIAETEARLAKAPGKDKPAIEAELERLRERKQQHLPLLERIAAMAADGRKVMLPLQEREIPIIQDDWAKPELGSGCVKVTPAHDPNDYDVWTRHRDHVDIINILNEDGSLNDEAGRYAGLDRFEARKRVVADLDAKGLLDKIEDREIEIDHSDRSGTIVEPYLSKQWFVRMSDVDGGIVLGRGTTNEFRAPGLAQAAIDAADPEWKSPTGRHVDFWPDRERYWKIYHSWLVEKRDWCISRQLWWGHRIPVWRGTLEREKLLALREAVISFAKRDDVAAWVTLPDGERLRPADAFARFDTDDSIAEVDVGVCFQDEDHDAQFGAILRSGGLEPDPDVLDTWFSSALWPHSTLGWPDPDTAPVGEGETMLGAHDGAPSSLDYYYPGSCLVTGRDIITLWVARMVMTGLYNLGDVPFTDVFLHATIQDGKGERMSKSKGNGVDPIDIIDDFGADAMRYVLCEVQTGTQDIRLPVQAISPFDGEPIEMAKAKGTDKQGVFLCPRTGKEFDMVGLYADQGVPGAKATSDRFEVGRNFCNKLWNASRFAFLNLENATFERLSLDQLEIEDRWILSRLSSTIAKTHAALDAYNPSVAVTAARDFFWYDLCDWYVELVKERMQDDTRAPIARQVLAAALDQTLRLLHPFVPFVTEELWSKLLELVPQRGVDSAFENSEFLCHAAWPESRASWQDRALEQRIEFMQEIVKGIREVRARNQVPPRQSAPVVIKAAGPSAEHASACRELIARSANADSIEIDARATKSDDSAMFVMADIEVYVVGVVDPDAERKKLEKERSKIAQRIEQLEKKLSNDGFVQKAPPAVVDKERATLEELRQQLAALR